MAANIYTVKKEINGVEYTAQFNGLSAYYEAIDSCYIDGTGNLSAGKLNKYILENVIVEPKVSMDDFDSLDELKEVIDFGNEVMRGKFRNKKDESADKKAG